MKLDGHADVGGKRITLYNDKVPLEGVRTLAEFMEEFESTYQRGGEEESY
ncbi:MAG: phosphoserine aminotransferase [Chlamydiales bacterium]